jgi:hypothetical protein
MKYEKRRPGRHRGDTVSSIQGRWHVCCASLDKRRFDCVEAPAEQRGDGPFLPVRPPTPAQLVARLVVDEPRQLVGVLRVREES